LRNRKRRNLGKEPIYFIENAELLDLFVEHRIGIRNEQVRYYQVDASADDFLK